MFVGEIDTHSIENVDSKNTVRTSLSGPGAEKNTFKVYMYSLQKYTVKTLIVFISTPEQATTVLKVFLNCIESRNLT